MILHLNEVKAAILLQAPKKVVVLVSPADWADLFKSQDPGERFQDNELADKGYENLVLPGTLLNPIMWDCAIKDGSFKLMPRDHYK